MSDAATGNSAAGQEVLAPGAIEAVVGLLDDIATSARTLDRSLFFDGSAEDRSTEELDIHLRVLRTIIAQMGWCADRGLSALGRSQCYGDADDWLLAPATVDALRGVTPATEGAANG